MRCAADLNLCRLPLAPHCLPLLQQRQNPTRPPDEHHRHVNYHPEQFAIIQSMSGQDHFWVALLAHRQTFSKHRCHHHHHQQQQQQQEQQQREQPLPWRTTLVVPSSSSSGCSEDPTGDTETQERSHGQLTTVLGGPSTPALPELRLNSSSPFHPSWSALMWAGATPTGERPLSLVPTLEPSCWPGMLLLLLWSTECGGRAPVPCDAARADVAGVAVATTSLLGVLSSNTLEAAVVQSLLKTAADSLPSWPP